MIMKRLYIFLLIATGLIQHVFSQTNSEQESFKQLILTQYDDYFEKVQFTKEGLTYLSAKEDYFSLSLEKKTSVMEFVLSKWEKKLVVVLFQYKRELWEKNASNTTVLLDSWDMNTLAVQQKNERTLQTTNVHPWFFYFGMNNVLGSSDYLNVSLSARVGFYLLDNTWDFAIFCTAGIYHEDRGSSPEYAYFNTGIMSKVYFPIKKYKISPYIGSGISYKTDNTYYNDANSYDSSSWDYPVYVGISWFVGPGSLDLGFQFGQNFTTTIGYTFSLGKK